MKQRNNETTRGFSLIELLVVIGIISIVSVASVVGFRGFSDSLITREAKGLIEDTVRQVEQEVLRDDYKTSKINFLEDFLVMESAPADKTLDLSLVADGGCTDGFAIDFGSAGTLTKKDGDGNILSAKSVVASTSECADFKDSEESEWVYQIVSGNEVSDVIRFIHFNVDRERLSGITLDGADVGATLTIEAPYAKKIVSVGDSQIDLAVTSENGSSEELIIK